MCCSAPILRREPSPPRFTTTEGYLRVLGVLGGGENLRARMMPSRPVLCLHGFTGTPFDVEALARALEARGYLVSAPMLPGHGRTVADLAATTADDWLSAADAELTRLTAQAGTRVAVAGASMGALLAVRLAVRRPDDVAALVLMAAPLRFRAIDRFKVRFLSRFYACIGMRTKAAPKKGGVGIADPEIRAMSPSLQELPFAGLDQLITLSDATVRDVPRVTPPALVIHGHLDRAVPLRVSEELASRLGSSIVERLWLDNSAHLVAIDRDRALVAERISEFLASHASWTRARDRSAEAFAERSR